MKKYLLDFPNKARKMIAGVEKACIQNVRRSQIDVKIILKWMVEH